MRHSPSLHWGPSVDIASLSRYRHVHMTYVVDSFVLFLMLVAVFSLTIQGTIDCEGIESRTPWDRKVSGSRSGGRCWRRWKSARRQSTSSKSSTAAPTNI